MKISLALAIVSLIALGATQQTHSEDYSQRCDALARVDFSRVPDAITQVTSATMVRSSADGVSYCDVLGYISPSVKFELWLPSDHWNGKFVELGCGGACGSTDHIADECYFPSRRGYACIVTDGGHPSGGIDVKWAYNNPGAMTEFLVRATHVTALAGKSIATRYYSQVPKKSYFMGCSTGGNQAMSEAQRFPWDFDGIVAGAPAIHTIRVALNVLWGQRAMMDESGKALLGQPDLDLLHQAVVAKCDLNDGIKDGLIGDPRACRFDPAELLCTNAKKSQCLTAKQVEAVKKIYGGPVTSTGEQIVPPAAQRGSERTWLYWFGGSTDHPSPIPEYIADWFRYYAFQPNPGPTWTLKEFDLDRDYKRTAAAEVIAPINPDLRQFKAAGGKLLAYTGWNDAIEGVLGTVDYYETTEKLMGGRAATQDFFRLFAIPGMDHCDGGDGAYEIDYLSYLEAWVEKGKAPDVIVGKHLDGELHLHIGQYLNSHDRKTENYMAELEKFRSDPANIRFTRPVYPYPVRAGYKGVGDPNDAANFGPVEP